MEVLDPKIAIENGPVYSCQRLFVGQILEVPVDGRFIEAALQDVFIPRTPQDAHEQRSAAPADEIVGAAQHGVQIGL